MFKRSVIRSLKGAWTVIWTEREHMFQRSVRTDVWTERRQMFDLCFNGAREQMFERSVNRCFNWVSTYVWTERVHMFERSLNRCLNGAWTDVALIYFYLILYHIDIMKTMSIANEIQAMIQNISKIPIATRSGHCSSIKWEWTKTNMCTVKEMHWDGWLQPHN
jgi:hypothetical protein